MKLLPLLLLLAPFCGQSQSFRFRLDTTVRVQTPQCEVLNPWSGGLNAALISTVHLNADTLADLVVFDRTNGKLSTFVAARGPKGYSYRYAPGYETLFPELHYWALLVDYDRDGRKDIFTYARTGVRVYRNVTPPGGKLSWEVAVDGVMTQGLSRLINLRISASDIPALVDVDNDGDIDVLTYDIEGSYLEFHQNQSVEKYGHARALEYRRVHACWGNFIEGAECGDFDFSIDCQSTGWLDARPADQLLRASLNTGLGTSRIHHAGSTILALDLDGDRDKDILVGDISCPSIFQMTNHGDARQAVFREFSDAFPQSRPIRFPIFPATYYEDVDFDGKPDLLASPNVFVNEGNQINFRESLWYYHNRGSSARPDFEFKSTNFLQSEALDFGEYAFPAFADYDADGDWDLFVGYAAGNNTEYTKEPLPVASVYLYENTGTAAKPVFALKTKDYLNLSSLQLSRMKPAFADLNGDGKTDFCLLGQKGPGAQLQYVLNTASPKKVFAFSPGKIQALPIAVDPNDSPAFADLDADGYMDMLLGKAGGKLAAYRNTGKGKTLNFTLENENLGTLEEPAVNRRFLVPVVADLDKDGKPDLLTGELNGQLRVNARFAENLFEFPVPAVELSGAADKALPRLGSALAPAAADLDGDGYPELIVGTNAGGLFYLKNLGR